MMSSLDRKSFERLGQTFRKAFDEKTRIESNPSEFWVASVMSAVRRMGPLNPQSDFWEVSEKMIWKFIPAAVALVLLLGVVFNQIAPLPHNVVSDIYNGGNLDLGLYALYGG